MSNKTLFEANLADYRNHLLGEERNLKPASVNAHLKSIRGRYRAMMKSNRYRDLLSSIATEVIEREQIKNPSIADQLAIVNELERRIENNIFTDDVFAREITKQDTSDEEQGIRLTESQAIQLIRAPGIHTLTGIRDTALLALLICTGIREHEAAALRVDDLRVHYQGHLALRVREGKGAKQRLVVYGTLLWCLEYVDKWLAQAAIESGGVFRGFWGDSDSIRSQAISVRQINRIVASYPVYTDTGKISVRPHDLRRTYARIQFNSNMDGEAIQQNMGHASYDTTLGYIGNLGAEKRSSKSTMGIPHSVRELNDK